MGQPIKKIIQETHGDLIAEEPIYTLLIDGNSLLFACFADETTNSNGKHYGGISQFMLQLRMQLQKKDYDYVYVFFDNKYSGYLRWELYKPYKENRDKTYYEYVLSDYMKKYNENLKNMQKYIFGKNKKKKEEDDNIVLPSNMTLPLINSRKKEISEALKRCNKESHEYIRLKSESKYYSKLLELFMNENFDRERDVLCLMFNELYIRWYIDEVVEGDDLIAYYCMNKKPNERIVIVTGDMDISQVLGENICIYNLQLKKYITNKNYKDYFGMPCENIMVKKVLCGDSSDNISNIAGLSEEKFFEIMPEAKEKPITIDQFKNRVQTLIDERVKDKKKPYKLHENIINGVSNKEYDGDFYDINTKIIDLKHPLMTDEAKEVMDSMMYAPQDPEGRSFAELYKIVNSEKMEDFCSETKFASFFNIFKRVEEKEVKRYNEFLKTQNE